MTTSNHRRTSKFLSLILRHQPELIDLQLDSQGWADVAELVDKINAKNGTSLSHADIADIVHTSDKQRFQLSDDRCRVRANQGHSVDVDLALDAVEPPAVLYHGTATRFVASIMSQGLTKRQRHHVHLSADLTTAEAVGARHGKLAVLLVDAAEMQRDGYEFFVTANDVWLTACVPAEYLTCQ